MSLPERIATLVLSTFNKLPQRCKPRTHTDGKREWTPMSAIVVASGEPENAVLKCVSLAAKSTGTKCLPASQIHKCNGLVLHDCHAEILALRGLSRWLLNEIKLLLESQDYVSDIVEACVGSTESTDIGVNLTPFQLCKDVGIYMFTTVAPCGDASMDLLISSSVDPTPWSEDALATDLSSGQPLGRGHFSLLGAVRRKPARRDAESTMSKSCTDKMALKQFTGALGFPADLMLKSDSRAFLKGLIVYEDQYNNVGYARAFGRSGRLEGLAESASVFFDVHVLPKSFERFEFERVPDDERCKVTNICAVYVAGSKGTEAVREVLVNGVKQGYKQFESRPGKGSVLCRRKMTELAQEISDLLDRGGALGQEFEPNMYSGLKRVSSPLERLTLKEQVIQHLGGWVSNAAEDDFSFKGASMV